MRQHTITIYMYDKTLKGMVKHLITMQLFVIPYFLIGELMFQSLSLKKANVGNLRPAQQLIFQYSSLILFKMTQSMNFLHLTQVSFRLQKSRETIFRQTFLKHLFLQSLPKNLNYIYSKFHQAIFLGDKFAADIRLYLTFSKPRYNRSVIFNTDDSLKSCLY